MVSGSLDQPKRRATRGFTLIELLVVLAIVGTLLTLVAPRYFGHVAAAKESVLRENLRITRDAIGRFYGDQGRFPERLEELVSARYLAKLPVDPITESTDTWLIEPVPEGHRGNVYDLHSGASGAGRDGEDYVAW